MSIYGKLVRYTDVFSVYTFQGERRVLRRPKDKEVVWWCGIPLGIQGYIYILRKARFAGVLA